MGKNDMDHMIHLESVALSDCAVLESKEATYQGSWKRAGGRSAWFMARRNLDRLITMMAPKEFPDHVKTAANIKDTVRAIDSIVHHGTNRAMQDHLPGSIDATRQILAMLGDSYFAEDLFAKIAENPGGEDGTVLACMRDARRYFTLVEAEMIAEGVVEPESKTYESDKYPQDIYTMISNDTGILRDEVKRRVHELFYSGKASVFATEPPPVPEAGPMIGGAFTKISEKDVVFPNARELKPEFEKVLDGGMVYQEGQRLRQPTIEELAAMGRSPEDGSHHASLVPWEIGANYRNTLIARAGGILIDAFYSQRTPDVWRLECVVKLSTIPRELKDCYDYTAVDGVPRWVLKRGDVPADLQDQFPLLQIEMNAFEHETSPPEFKFMYSPVGEKIILRQDYRDWAREA